MMRALLRPFLRPERALPEQPPVDVAVYRSRWIPALAGVLSGMGAPAAAVTLGDVIVVHPDQRLTARLLRHELEHVRQWRAQGVLFPLRYAWNHLRYGYEQNPYEVAARNAEQQPAQSTDGDRS